MARKLPGLQRELDARALFSVAYGEVASSIYFALGVLAAHALGFTPLVLLAVGLLFLLVSFSYAEGTAALPETGGAATFVRRALNDLAGFMTGWALFLDYLIVIALSALFLPHYLAGAFQVQALDRNPGDVIVAVCVIALVALVRVVRRPSLYGFGIIVPALDLLTQLLLVVLGFALVFSPHALTRGISLGTHPSWHAIAFSLPLAMLAFTGLETVANLAEEARRPGVDLPRSLFGGIATVVTIYVAIAVVAISAFPGPQTELGTRWIRSPLLGVAQPDRQRAAVRSRRCAAGVRRNHGRADPLRRGHHVDLRLLAARLLPWRARPVAAELRSAQSPRARVPAGDPRRRRDLVRDRDRHLVHTSTTSRSSPASSRSACCSRSLPRSSP